MPDLTTAQLEVIRGMLVAPIDKKVEEMAKRASELDQQSTALVTAQFEARYNIIIGKIELLTQTLVNQAQATTQLIEVNNRRLIQIERSVEKHEGQLQSLQAFRRTAIAVASGVGSIIGAVSYWIVEWIFGRHKA